MASNSWARRSTSLLALILAASGYSQSFGRFSYDAQPTAPGFIIDRSGFAVQGEPSTPVTFAAPVASWTCIETEGYRGSFVAEGPKLSPKALHTNLFGSGFSLQFEAGIELGVSTKTSPFLTWQGGSVGDGVTTPPSQTILLSFQEELPPLAFHLVSGASPWIIEGQPGAWRIRATQAQGGWLRIAAPLGRRPMATGDAESLGKLLELAGPTMAAIELPEPELKERKAISTSSGLVVKWDFSAPGARVPPVVLQAQSKGYPLRIESVIKRSGFEDAEGPVATCTGKELRVVFPTRPHPGIGRGLVVGDPTDRGIATASPYDLQGVVAMAFASLDPLSDRILLEAAEATNNQFMTEADGQVEPVTGQRMPWDGTDDGIRLAAGHALLSSAIHVAEGGVAPQSLLTSFDWMVDPFAWRLARAPSAGSLAALAGLISPNPEHQALGAMLFVGLPEGAEPALHDLLRCLADRSAPLTPFAAAWLSQVRLVSPEAVRLTQTPEGTRLDWSTPDARPMTLNLAGSALTIVGHSPGIRVVGSSVQTASFGDHWILFTSGAKLPARAVPPLVG